MNSNPAQPLEIAPEDRVTLEQLKHRAEAVSNLAVGETKRVATDVIETSAARVAMIAVGTIVVVASLAYFMGQRAAQRSAPTSLPL